MLYVGTSVHVCFALFWIELTFRSCSPILTLLSDVADSRAGLPQLYCGGELLGGLDIMKEMAQADELKAALRPQA